MPLSTLFFDVEQVLGIFPDSVKPSKKDLTAYAKAQGTCSDVLGKIAFTEKDVQALVDSLAAAPTNTTGPSRMMQKFPAHTVGFMVVIADALDPEVPVYIGFAPNDETGVADLLRMVQFGYPGELNVICAIPQTAGEVEEFREYLKKDQVHNGWYYRSAELNDKIVAMRDRMRGVVRDEDEDEDETPDEGETDNE